jgi:hypothetical protein
MTADLHDTVYPVQRPFISMRSKSPASLAVQCHDSPRKGGDVMERRHFMKLAFGVAAGAAALAASTQAAPLMSHPLAEDERLPANEAPCPAVATEDEVNRLKPEEVRWGRRWHPHWHRRHWGWRRRHWHRRYW